MAAPVEIMTPVYQINLTMLLSVVTVCLTALAVLIKVFGRKKEEEPGQHPSCLSHKETAKRVEKDHTDLKDKTEKETKDLRDKVDKMRTEVSVMSVKMENTGKTVDELKTDSKKLADKMDSLLSQMLDFLD